MRYPAGVLYLVPRGAEEIRMIRSRRLVWGAGVLAMSAAAFLFTGGGNALAKGKKVTHLRFAKTWAEAVTQARSRNAIIFATFHKDN